MKHLILLFTTTILLISLFFVPEYLKVGLAFVLGWWCYTLYDHIENEK